MNSPKDEPTVDSVAADLARWVALTPGLDTDSRIATEATRQRIGRIARLLGRVLTEVADDHHLTPGDWEALSVLVRAERPCTPGEIGHALALTSGTVSSRLRRLDAAGYTEAVSSDDARSRPVRVTAAGRRRWAEATADRVAREHRLFEVLSDAQTATLNELLTVLLAEFEHHLGPAPAHDRVG